MNALDNTAFKMCFKQHSRHPVQSCLSGGNLRDHIITISIPFYQAFYPANLSFDPVQPDNEIMFGFLRVMALSDRAACVTALSRLLRFSFLRMVFFHIIKTSLWELYYTHLPYVNGFSKKRIFRNSIFHCEKTFLGTTYIKSGHSIIPLRLYKLQNLPKKP